MRTVDDATDSAGLRLSTEESQILSGWLVAPETPRSVARRATIIRELARGRSNSEVARELGVSRSTVIHWHRRFRRDGLRSLYEVRPGRGRRRSVSTRTVRAILRAGRRGNHAVPSFRELAETSGVSAATVYRLWDAHGVRRNGNGTHTDRTEPRVLAGVFLDPPDRVIALRSEASPERTTGILSRAVVRTLDGFDRKVVGDCMSRDRERAFLKFLRAIERTAEPSSPIVLVLDSAGGTHRRASVRRWLGSRSGVELRIDDASSTAELLSRAIGEARSTALPGALASFLDELRAYLRLYDGEPDRFVWVRT